MPTKRIVVRSGMAPWERFSAGAIYQANLMGTNTGNFIFTDAAHALLTTPSQVTTSSRYLADMRTANHYNEKFDHFVIPLANAFRPSFRPHLRALTALIRRLEIPVTVLGVGVQLDLSGDFGRLGDMEVDIKDFMRVVLDRSPSVGVRGEFTLQYLQRLGFKEVEIIGCPSMFTFGRELPLAGDVVVAPQSNMAVTISPYVPDIEAFVSDAQRLFPHLTYFVQDRPTLEELVLRSGQACGRRRNAAPGNTSDDLLRNARSYFSVSSWIEGLRGFDFSFGTRIHGSIAAVLAGIPVVLFAHDSRTLELARYFEIPHRTYSPHESVNDLHRLSDLYQPDPMMLNHEHRFHRFANFVADHGLNVNERPTYPEGRADDFVQASTSTYTFSSVNPRVAIDLARAWITTPGRLGRYLAGGEGAQID